MNAKELLTLSNMGFKPSKKCMAVSCLHGFASLLLDGAHDGPTKSHIKTNKHLTHRALCPSSWSLCPWSHPHTSQKQKKRGGSRKLIEWKIKLNLWPLFSQASLQTISPTWAKYLSFQTQEGRVPDLEHHGCSNRVEGDLMKTLSASS